MCIIALRSLYNDAFSQQPHNVQVNGCITFTFCKVFLWRLLHNSGVRKVFEDPLKTVRNLITSYKELNLLIQNSVHRCSNDWFKGSFDVTTFNRIDGFNVVTESLTCTQRIVCSDIIHYSHNGGF